MVTTPIEPVNGLAPKRPTPRMTPVNSAALVFQTRCSVSVAVV